MQITNLGSRSSSISTYAIDSSIQNDKGICKIQQLQIRKNQCLNQLQHETALLEQQQEILKNKQNQIISYQPVLQLIDLLCTWYTNKLIKERKKTHLGQQLKRKIKQLNEIQQKIKRKQKLVDRFHNKLYVYLLGQLKTVSKLLKYGEQLNIKTIIQSSISKYIYSMTHKSKHYHAHSQSTILHKQCGENCPYEEMMSFIKEYKNDNIWNRVRQGWIMMEKELRTQIDHYMEQYGQQISNIGTHDQNDSKTIEQRCRLNKEIMDIKVDLQIIITEVQIMKAQLRLVQDNTSCSSVIFSGVIANIRSIILQLYEKQVQNEETDENKLINKIQRVFNGYYLQIYKEYTQSKQVINDDEYDSDNDNDNEYNHSYEEKSITQINQENSSILNATLNKFIQALTFSLEVCQTKFQIQARIQRIQKYLNKLNHQINKYNEEESTKAIFQSFQSNHNLQFDPLFSEQLYSHRNTDQISNKRISIPKLTHTDQKISRSKISIQNAYNLQHIQYRVKKIMHITTVTPNDQLLMKLKLHGKNDLNKNHIRTNQGDKNYGVNSRLLSRTNSRVNISPMPDSQVALMSTSTMKRSKNISQQYNERTLSFGRKKLILHKANPHFHQQIQIKRIQKIKQINQKLVHIYFKKGYMTLEFIPNDDSQANQVKMLEIHRRGLAREWIKYFKALYYEIADQIQFIDSQQEQYIGNYDIKRRSQRNSQIMIQNRETYRNKENDNANKEIKKYKQHKKGIHIQGNKQNEYQYQLFTSSQQITDQNHQASGRHSQYIIERHQESYIQGFR